MASTRSSDGTSSRNASRTASKRAWVVAQRVVAVDKRTWVQGRPAAYSVAGQGLPVVFLHGWALAQHTYRSVVERIAAQGTTAPWRS